MRRLSQVCGASLVLDARLRNHGYGSMYQQGWSAPLDAVRAVLFWYTPDIRRSGDGVSEYESPDDTY